MTIESLDISRVEQGIGAGKIVNITGNPFIPTPDRTPGFGPTPMDVGNADGYDISSATAIRLYWDLDLGSGTYALIRVVPMAADPGADQKPVVQAGGEPSFPPKLAVFDGAANELKAQDGDLKLTATGRGSLTLPRPSILVRFEIESDDPTVELALAAQSVLDGGGE